MPTTFFFLNLLFFLLNQITSLSLVKDVVIRSLILPPIPVTNQFSIFYIPN